MIRAKTTRSRYALTASIFIVFVVSVLLVIHVADILGQYRTYEYVVGLVFDSEVSPQAIAAQPIVGDKIIIVAKVENENTDWIEDLLPDWQHAIYHVNPTNTTAKDALTTPINKGHEAMAYLTYLVDYYDSLPSTMAFLHSHRKGFLKAWHTDTPLHDNVFAMQHLQLDHVQQSGYVNLRCKWNPGCLQTQRQSLKHITPEIWHAIFANTSTPPFDADSWLEQNPRAFAMPTAVGVACCAQFVVSRDQVWKRPREDYVAFRNWLTQTTLNDAKSGRVFEYLWHIIFDANAVHCPNEQTCYCNVYGICS